MFFKALSDRLLAAKAPRLVFSSVKSSLAPRCDERYHDMKPLNESAPESRENNGKTTHSSAAHSSL